MREALSARLDSEQPGVAETVLDEHLAGCRHCAAWYQAAARVTRMTRLGPALPVTDLAERVLTELGPDWGRSSPAVPAAATRPERVLRAVRWTLAAVALGQFALAAAQVVGHYLEHLAASGGSSGHAHASAAAGLGHLAHESASWNVALSVGMFWVAVQVRRATGLLPVLAAFVLILGVMSGVDLALGQQPLDRVGSALLPLVGLVLVAWLARLVPAGSGTSSPGDPLLEPSVPAAPTAAGPAHPSADGSAGFGDRPDARSDRDRPPAARRAVA